MYRRTLLALLLSAPLVFGQTPSLKLRTHSVAELQADERVLVGQWCRLDFEGTRLTDQGWQKFDSLTTIKRNPDYGIIYVVSRYQMEPQERVTMNATVSYNVIGTYELGVGFLPANESRSVNFKFAEKDGDLQIVDVDPIQPAVSKTAFIAWLKAQLASAKSEPDKMTLQRALDQLVPPPPKPKAPVESSSSKQMN